MNRALKKSFVRPSPIQCYTWPGPPPGPPSGMGMLVGVARMWGCLNVGFNVVVRGFVSALGVGLVRKWLGGGNLSVWLCEVG